MRKHLRRLYLLSISALIVLICGCYEKEEKKDVSANEERTERKEYKIKLMEIIYR